MLKNNLKKAQAQKLNRKQWWSFVRKEARQIIDIFTSSVISTLIEGKDISLQGFGNFFISKVLARNGRNPKTGKSLIIAAYNKPKFKVSQRMKKYFNAIYKDNHYK